MRAKNFPAGALITNPQDDPSPPAFTPPKMRRQPRCLFRFFNKSWGLPRKCVGVVPGTMRSVLVVGSTRSLLLCHHCGERRWFVRLPVPQVGREAPPAHDRRNYAPTDLGDVLVDPRDRAGSGAAGRGSPEELQGTWTATKAERDGKAADDVVGHRLSFTGNRFQIQSKDGKPLYAGTIRVDPSAKPAAIDFEHTEGALKGKAWKGIYALDGDTLTTCDNAPNLDKGRPAAFEAKSGSGYVLITFKGAKP